MASRFSSRNRYTPDDELSSKNDGLSWGCILAVIALILFFVFGLRGCVGGVGREYSTGARAGTVTKFSYKGIIFKSWEGELVMGGLRLKTATDSNSGSHQQYEANVFAFNADPAVASELEKALLSGQRVELQYRQWWIAPLWIDHKHVVTVVKPTDN